MLEKRFLLYQDDAVIWHTLSKQPWTRTLQH